jgi:hypothetical protein
MPTRSAPGIVSDPAWTGQIRRACFRLETGDGVYENTRSRVCCHCLCLPQYLVPRNLVCVRGRLLVVSCLGETEKSLRDADSIKFLCIPSSIEILAHSCFRGSRGLKSVVFERDCHVCALNDSAVPSCESPRPSSLVPPGEPLWISRIGQCAFHSCPFLESICVPSSIKTLRRCYFAFG